MRPERAATSATIKWRQCNPENWKNVEKQLVSSVLILVDADFTDQGLTDSMLHIKLTRNTTIASTVLNAYEDASTAKDGSNTKPSMKRPSAIGFRINKYLHLKSKTVVVLFRYPPLEAQSNQLSVTVLKKVKLYRYIAQM